MKPAPDLSRLVLAIDTSSDICVGLASADRVLAATRWAGTPAHVENLSALVRQTLDDGARTLNDPYGRKGSGSCDTSQSVTVAQLTHVVVGMGPGPFTGLRAGIATAETLAWAHDLRLHRVCSLDVVGHEWAARRHQMAIADPGPDGEFVVALDARRKELYWARFDPDGTRIGDPQVTGPDALPEVPVIGPGADLYPQVHRDRRPRGPRAVDAGLLALDGLTFPDVGQAPLYLRRPDATAPTSRKSTLVRRKRLALPPQAAAQASETP